MTKFPPDDRIDVFVDGFFTGETSLDDWYYDTEMMRVFVHSILEHWGTPEPTALEDREPQQTDLDDEDCCWWWEEGNQSYERFCGDAGGIASLKDYNKRSLRNYTHWLPHWAIKQPSEKEE